MALALPPSPGSAQILRRGRSLERCRWCFGKLETFETSKGYCFASQKRGFGSEPVYKENSGKMKQKKDATSETGKLRGDSKTNLEQAPKLKVTADGKSSNAALDPKFLEKVESVRRSALEKKKAEEKKLYQPIDYDAPIESDKSTVSFGTKVGVGIAVLVFGLVFALGDFLPSRFGPTEDSTEVSQILTDEEMSTLKRALEGFEITLSKSPNDLDALKAAAATLVDLGEYAKASNYLQKLIKESPNDADAYRLLGEVKYKLKDYEGSVTAYRSSLSSSENIQFEVLRGLTNSLVDAKRPNEAVEVLLSAREKLDAAKENGPSIEKIDLIQLDLLLGKVYADWGHNSDAVAVYEKLINDHPDDFRGYLVKGVLLKENGKVGDAERMFIQAKFLAPEGAKVLVDRYSRR